MPFWKPPLRSARRLPSDRMVWRPRGRPRTEARGRRRDGHSGDLTPDGPDRKHYSCGLRRSRACCIGTVRRSRVAGVAIEDALELWAVSLREVKRQIRPLFTQERVAVSAGLFLAWVTHEIRDSSSAACSAKG